MIHLCRAFRYSFILSEFIVSGCVHIPEAGNTVLRPSQLNSEPLRYKGKDVLVRGYVTLESDGHTLYESKYLNDEFVRRWGSGDKSFDPKEYMIYCLTIANPRVLYDNRALVTNRTLIIKGKFIDNYLNGKFIDFGACPLPTAVYVYKVYIK